MPLGLFLLSVHWESQEESIDLPSSADPIDHELGSKDSGHEL